MTRKLDYRWHLRQVMASRGMFATTDLIEPLAQRGIHLSSSQRLSSLATVARGLQPDRMGVIMVDHLRKTYRRVVAVDDLSFDVEAGEIFGILGPNGAGKTTTVECVQGLRRPDGGTIRVLGLDPATQAAQLRQRIGSQLQDSSLPGRLRIAESIELFAAFAHHPVDCDELLARWGLDDQRAQAFDSLSGGQRQRLFIALAFVNSLAVRPGIRRSAWFLAQDRGGRGSRPRPGPGGCCQGRTARADGTSDRSADWRRTTRLKKPISPPMAEVST